MGYSDLATPAGNQARTILDQLLNEQPNNPQWQLDLADSHHAIGYSLYSNQQYDEAIKEYREGLAIRVKIAKAYPRPEWQILEAESYSAIGDALFDSNRREEALENYMNGLNIGTKVVADDKTNNPEWLARLSTSYLGVRAPHCPTIVSGKRWIVCIWGLNSERKPRLPSQTMHNGGATCRMDMLGSSSV